MSLASVLAQLSRGGGLPQRFRPFANQAANEAYLRFAPEWEGLNQLRAQSASTMRQNVGQANSAAQLISALANEGQRTLNATSNPLVQRLAAYDNPPAGSSSAVVAQSLGLGHDAISGMLGQAALNAPLRASQQAQQALAAHQQDLEQIGGKRASLAGQVGAFTQGRLGDLVNADRKQRSDLNKSLRDVRTRLLTSGVDPSGHVIKGGPKDPAIKPQSASDKKSAADLAYFEKHGYYPPTGPPKNGPSAKNPGNIKLLEPAGQTTQVSAIKGAQKGIAQLAGQRSKKTGKPITREQIELLLRSGQVDGVKYTQPQIDVAMDLHHNSGRVSDRGARVLHTIGVSVQGHFKNTHGQRPARRSRRVSAPLGPAGPLSS